MIMYYIFIRSYGSPVYLENIFFPMATEWEEESQKIRMGGLLYSPRFTIVGKATLGLGVYKLDQIRNLRRFQPLNL